MYGHSSFDIFCYFGVWEKKIYRYTYACTYPHAYAYTHIYIHSCRLETSSCSAKYCPRTAEDGSIFVGVTAVWLASRGVAFMTKFQAMRCLNVTPNSCHAGLGHLCCEQRTGDLSCLCKAFGCMFISKPCANPQAAARMEWSDVIKNVCA